MGRNKNAKYKCEIFSLPTSATQSFGSSFHLTSISRFENKAICLEKSLSKVIGISKLSVGRREG